MLDHAEPMVEVAQGFPLPQGTRDSGCVSSSLVRSLRKAVAAAGQDKRQSDPHLSGRGLGVLMGKPPCRGFPTPQRARDSVRVSSSLARSLRKAAAWVP